MLSAILTGCLAPTNRPLGAAPGAPAVALAPVTGHNQGVAQQQSRVDSRIADGSNTFGFGLLKELATKEQKRNVFVSPISISTALAMTYNGACKRTRDSMARVLGLSGMSLDDINKGYSTLASVLENPGKGVKLSVANSLWARMSVGFKPDFLEHSKLFGAKVDELDFDEPHTIGIINDWVRAKAEGKIDGIIEQIDPDTIMFLINGVYFKAD